MATMKMKGGNTDVLYTQNEKMDGRLLMAQSLYNQHPDVTKVVWKWGRWQHSVDYRPFAKNKLKLKEGEIKPIEYKIKKVKKPKAKKAEL